MVPRLVQKGAFSVVGLKCSMGELSEWGDLAMGRAWEVFLDRSEAVTERYDPTVLLGITVGCVNSYDGRFTYLACMEVSSDADPPAGMVLYDFPPQQYAVFEHRGPLVGLSSTYYDIFDDWLPAAGLTPSDEYMDSIEHYEDGLSPTDPDFSVELWIPLA